MNAGELSAVVEPSTVRCPHVERKLLIDSRQFAVESPRRNWYELAITLCAFALVVASALLDTNPWIQVSCGIVLGLMYVRIFAIYHDYMHGSIFRKSKAAGWLLKAFGLFLLTPPSVWKHNHDYHHKHNTKLFGVDIGSFTIMTVREYRSSGLIAKLEYRLTRSLFVMLTGYFFVFLWGMSIVPLITKPRKHLDCLAALALHFSIGCGIAIWFGWATFGLLFAMPLAIATTFGTYLFYVQHNFPGAHVADEPDWTYTRAAIYSSSYLKAGPLLNWFTANIGFHHVHHLNAKIPFYRLSEAHDALPLLQHATQTTFKLSDIWASLKLKLWDEDQACFVGFAESKPSAN